MYGLIGKSLGHSFSADFFKEKFSRERIDETYQLFPIGDIEELPGLLNKHPNLKGLNVTIPYKESVMKFLSEISCEAREIGAVNVIKIKRSEKNLFLKGYNTDCIGFSESLKKLLTPHISSALILGTGGASKAVAYVLKNLGIDFIFVSRKKSVDTLCYNELTPEIIKDHRLIVNTTPLGTYPNINECPDIPYNLLSDRHICYDLVYNPDETKFLFNSKNQGAVTKNGLEMLHRQALAAWDIWTSDI